MITDLIDPILDCIKKAQNQEILYNGIYTSPSPKTGKNEFLFFIKPEITIRSESIKLAKIIEFILEKIDNSGYNIHNIIGLAAHYLEEHNIIAQHYGIINQISSNVRAYLSDSAKSKFYEFYGKSIDDVKALGSLELIHKHKNLHAYTLDYLWQNLEYKKLASGTYCAPIRIDNEVIYVFNGFHPRQIKHFTKKGSNIIVMTLSSDNSWADARNNFVGATNPFKANENSLRWEFLNRKAEFGLPEVSQSYNGVHLSAGPVEALAELKRFNSNYLVPNGVKEFTDFPFGRALSTVFGGETDKIVNNEVKVDIDGKATSIYDLTEEKDSDEALELLKNFVPARHLCFNT